MVKYHLRQWSSETIKFGFLDVFPPAHHLFPNILRTCSDQWAIFGGGIPLPPQGDTTERCIGQFELPGANYNLNLLNFSIRMPSIYDSERNCATPPPPFTLQGGLGELQDQRIWIP